MLSKRYLCLECEDLALWSDEYVQANALQPNWGQSIFQSANEMHHNAILRDRLAYIQAKGKKDREWWDQEKATIQSNFMRELGEDEKENSKPAAASLADRAGSDEDAVLVEGGGPATLGASKGAARKRKGKK